MTFDMIDSHYWANVMRAGADDDDAQRVMDAINQVRVNRASVMLVCVQILAENIVDAPVEVKAEIRTGIITMIDDYTMRHAIVKADKETP